MVASSDNAPEMAINVAAFTVAGIVTALLVLAPALRDPPTFLFGNVGYIQLNARYYAASLPTAMR
jgi:hypothetical protein